MLAGGTGGVTVLALRFLPLWGALAGGVFNGVMVSTGDPVPLPVLLPLLPPNPIC